MTPAKFESVTPILIVDEIESCLTFWTTLGFQSVAQVPHGDKLGFAMLVNGGISVMYQSVASLGSDLQVNPIKANSVVYLTVDNLDAVEALLDKASIAIPRRKTFYNRWEVWTREPGGNLIGFAQDVKE
jgi:hypothetical protein